eukprot:9232910-Alexandrium_andersonii.AAC.1
MSASLVGSEMCIRDSSRKGLSGGSLGRGSLERVSREGLSGGSLGRAVSYTHLTLPTICSV